MFNADCHVRVVYLIMCKPTTLLHLHATLYVLFFVCTVGLRVYIAVHLQATRKLYLLKTFLLKNLLTYLKTYTLKLEVKSVSFFKSN